MLLPDIDSFQAAVHHDKLEYTLLVSVFYMHMNRLMLIGVEVEYESEVFVYFRLIVVIVSRCKDTNNYSSGKINVVVRRIIALPVIQNKIRRFNRRRQSDELEHQAQNVFVYFHVLCHMVLLCPISHIKIFCLFLHGKIERPLA